jgi:hypothetical protein
MRNVGFQPLSPTLRDLLNNSIIKREPEEEIVVHHMTDTKDFLQLEVERRSKQLGFSFERIVIRRQK